MNFGRSTTVITKLSLFKCPVEQIMSCIIEKRKGTNKTVAVVSMEERKVIVFNMIKVQHRGI